MQVKEKAMKVIEKITGVQKQCRVGDVDLSEELRFDLMEVVYEWARGVVKKQNDSDFFKASIGFVAFC